MERKISKVTTSVEFSGVKISFDHQDNRFYVFTHQGKTKEFLSGDKASQIRSFLIEFSTRARNA